MISQRDALYRAICDHPDEDTPRLAFADLVEEEGISVWADFIRTQVELARVPEYDPLWAKCRLPNCDAIAGHMMTDYLPKPLPAGFSWYKFAFNRGFSWLTSARDDALSERGPSLFAAAPIQALDFDGERGWIDPAVLADCPHLTRLRRLDFSNTLFDAEDTARFGSSPHADNLTELSLGKHALKPDGLQGLVESSLFRRLAALHLTENLIPPALLVDALAAAEEPGRLRKLTLPYCGITQHDIALFALPVMRSLAHLDLGDNRFGVEGVEALAESRVLRGLEVLKLSGTLPGVPGVKALTQTSALGGVRWLDLSHNRLGPVAVRLLAESRHTHGLRVLDLSGNLLGNAGAAALAGSRHLAGLVELVLSNCDIKDAGAIALAESPHLDGLIRLDLRSHTSRPFGADARRALLDRFGSAVSFTQ